MKRFLRDTAGNVGIILALVSVPLVGGAGIAVDFANKTRVEAKVQASIDSGALAGAAMTNATESNIREAIEEFAKANGVDKYLNHQSSLNIDIDETGVITVTATGTVDTTLGRVLGYDKMSIAATTQARRGEAGAEIALVLDVTGSMAGSKIDTLKSASTDFIDIVSRPNEIKPDAVKVSIVPYAQYVNVGMANRHATWMDVPDDSSTTNNVCQDWTNYSNPHNCRSEPYTSTSDGVQTSGTTQVCDYDSETVNECRPVTSSVVWRGCAGSREYPWNVRDGNAAYEIPGAMNQWCPNEITPLTSDKTRLSNEIQNLVASGNTYLPAGLIWGWRTLSAEVPYTEGVTSAVATEKNISKHLVLMTDGVNVTSKNVGEPTHIGWDPVEGNRITSELCDNVKAAGITVYTVAFQVTDAATSTMLRECATAPGLAFDADSAQELTTSFEAIAAKVAAIHLSK